MRCVLYVHIFISHPHIIPVSSLSSTPGYASEGVKDPKKSKTDIAFSIVTADSELGDNFSFFLCFLLFLPWFLLVVSRVFVFPATFSSSTTAHLLVCFTYTQARCSDGKLVA